MQVASAAKAVISDSTTAEVAFPARLDEHGARHTGVNHVSARSSRMNAIGCASLTRLS
jgi:hypothetical protein